MAVVLLSGATLLTASFARLIRVDPGFDADRVIAVRLGGLPPEYDAPRRERLVDRLLERVRALPGVEHAAAAPATSLPTTSPHSAWWRSADGSRSTPARSA